MVKVHPIKKNNLSKKEKLWLEVLANNNIILLNQGGISVKRWIRSKKGELTPTKTIINDINSAIRMQDHILDKYKIDQGELSTLDSVEEVIKKANDILLNWKKMENRQKENLQFELLSTILLLSRCRNEHKISIRDQLEEVSEFKDILDRVNPGAMAARTVAALNELGKRFKEVGSIIPQIALRKELLLLEKRRVEVQFIRCAQKLQYISRIKPLKNGKISQDQKNIINQEIGKALFYLNNIWTSPYFENAEEMKKILKEAKKELRKNKFKETSLLIKKGLNLIMNTQFSA